MKSQILMDIFQALFNRYGRQYWWPADTPFEVMVGAVLTQSASWSNVEKAMRNLKSAGALSPRCLLSLPVDEIAALIHPSGYYNVKAKKLKALVQWLIETCGHSIDRLPGISAGELRGRLLAVYGIGPETADSILLYAVGKPVFVIDAYTRRVFTRLGIAPDLDAYGAWQKMFTDNLPEDAGLFNEYHALIVKQAKEHCRAKPACAGCCLFDICAYNKAH